MSRRSKPYTPTDPLVLDVNIRLTPSHERVVELLAKGFVNLYIAERLSLSEKTVEHHLAAIYQTLHIPTNSQYAHRVMLAMWWWHRHTLIRSEQNNEREVPGRIS